MTAPSTPTILEELEAQFKIALGVDWRAPLDLRMQANAFLKATGEALNPEAERKAALLALINRKLQLSRNSLQTFLNAAASSRVFPNYHDKEAILSLLDGGDEAGFEQYVRSMDWPDGLAAFFHPLSETRTVAALHEQLEKGEVRRSDAREASLDEKRTLILRSLFGGFVFRSVSECAAHGYFDPRSQGEYEQDYFAHLKAHYGAILNRDRALLVGRVDASLWQSRKYTDLRALLCAWIAESYDALSNHCYLALQISAPPSDRESEQWRLYSDLVLFAEKHRSRPIGTGYFRPGIIAENTIAHIPSLDAHGAEFGSGEEAFAFKDCFVLVGEQSALDEPRSYEPASLLVTFEKNERDESPLPCPACRSLNISGNSYPVVGVRSWECQNLLCPERSQFDRGNRYSLSSLIRQEAIKRAQDQIPEGSLRKWRLDVVVANDGDAVEMLVRHYSLHGDAIQFVNINAPDTTYLGRKVEVADFDASVARTDPFAAFEQGSFFKRFLYEREAPDCGAYCRVDTGSDDVHLFRGDCYDAIGCLTADSLDGAVTSPPYYNAREYSTWPNIYCYLFDVYNAARQVFRTLKPGGVFLYNIFDYFDNENTLVFSAMGKKRMILGPYIAYLFQRIGFEFAGNTVWQKGQIEGKRNHNQGNRSPYYQMPLNCWEHILVFRKPGGESSPTFPTLLNLKPVFKIVRGENVLGHTAPFPSGIPDLLLESMKPGETILDPYGGSMTTARAAWAKGLKSVSVELHDDYCQLGVRLIRGQSSSIDVPSLFDEE